MNITLNLPDFGTLRLKANIYAADRTHRAVCLQAFDANTGEPIAKLTVYLAGLSEKLQDNQLLVKGYAENDGVPAAIEEAGLGKVGREVNVGTFIFDVTNPELLELMAGARPAPRTPKARTKSRAKAMH